MNPKKKYRSRKGNNQNMKATETKEQSAPEMEDTLQEPVEEAVEAPAEEAPAEEVVNPLQAELDAANAKVDEFVALAQRVQADFDNFRRRNESVRADAYAEGQRMVAAAMLPVLDNLERAMDAAQNSADESMKAGVEMTLRQMKDALTKLNVTAIERLGEKFDPNLENAVLQGTAEEGEPGTVCAVFQKGYKMGDAVLRHAMVKVVAE